MHRDDIKFFLVWLLPVFMGVFMVNQAGIHPDFEAWIVIFILIFLGMVHIGGR